jgi:branched-chain amino acid transport system permease protein
MSGSRFAFAAVALAVIAALAAAPVMGNDYTTSLGINLLIFGVLATAWGMFSGTTRYISLAAVSFFGLGAYVTAVFADHLPFPALIGVAAVAGAVFALMVGLATLRLSGMYFAIFTFGLTELVRQLVTWYEVNVSRSLGRYVFMDISPSEIYWKLLVLFLIVLGCAWWVSRSKLGFALRLIGEDEAAARHCGVDTTRAKLVMFVISSVFMVLVGVIVAPRWSYIEPSIAFNAQISFQVVIMALLGGVGTFWGPLLGVVPLVLLFEILIKYFPNHFSIVLGLGFLLVVYALPRGVLGLVQGWRRRTDSITPNRDPASHAAVGPSPLPAKPGSTRE